MTSIRDRAGAALRLAMRDRDRDALAALRGLIAAWDNATAVPVEPATAVTDPRLGVGAAAAARRELAEADLRALARAEHAEHRAAADCATARGDRMSAERLTRQAAAIEAVLADAETQPG